MFCLGDRVMRVGESGWKFSLAVLLPVIVAVALTVALAAGFIVWSAGRSDDRSLRAQCSTGRARNEPSSVGLGRDAVQWPSRAPLPSHAS